jgi:ribulose-phosphate 3-epimerase
MNLNNNRPRLVAPSVLAADFANLQKEIEMINQSQADWIHIDIMDGMFVPNISFGMPVLEAIQRHARKPLDVHLMIEKPERYLETFKHLGASHLTVHYEACTHLHRTIQQIKELDCKVGVALNPHTPIHLLEEVIDLVDIVLVMSVNPGFGGQKLIPSIFDKVAKLRKMIDEKSLKTLIEMDGGVNESNFKSLFEAGADVLVAGNFVFSSENPLETIERVKNKKNAARIK